MKAQKDKKKDITLEDVFKEVKLLRVEVNALKKAQNNGATNRQNEDISTLKAEVQKRKFLDVNQILNEKIIAGSKPYVLKLMKGLHDGKEIMLYSGSPSNPTLLRYYNTKGIASAIEWTEKTLLDRQEKSDTASIYIEDIRKRFELDDSEIQKFSREILSRNNFLHLYDLHGAARLYLSKKERI